MLGSLTSFASTAGGGALLGGIGAGILGGLGQERTNQANAEMAKKMMEFQERMSNTAHQRQIKDLRAAGINPILSAKLGGATTPSGAQATMQNSAKAALDGFNTTRSATAQVQNIVQDSKLKKMQELNTGAMTDKIVNEIQNLRETRKLIQNNARGKELDNSYKELGKGTLDATGLTDWIHSMIGKGKKSSNMPNIKNGKLNFPGAK